VSDFFLISFTNFGFTGGPVSHFFGRVDFEGDDEGVLFVLIDNKTNYNRQKERRLQSGGELLLITRCELREQVH
jgi:hypothetical protein